MPPARARRAYSCGACGQQAPRWMGRCPGCGEWDTLVEQPSPLGARGAVARAALEAVAVPSPVRLADLADTAPQRLPIGIPELDRVLGGGLVAGSVVLIGGEPGIGKSTLVLQALAALATPVAPGSAGAPVLLVTGEESAVQVRGRAERLDARCDDIAVLPETRLEVVLATIAAHRPAVCAIDSVQTLRSDALEAAPGSVAQVRHAAAELVAAAKEGGTTILLVGQVTKDGALAGPRTLEHMVDCVLAFEGDDLRAQRVLRATKNRFGATDETGIFEMGARGLASVEDPTRLYLAEVGERVGSCVFPIVQGTRALLVEVQALVGPTQLVPPRRVAGGVDRTRLAQVIAVLSRHAGLRLGDQDVFVSVAGGARTPDPAADLAIALAVASGHRGTPLPAGTVAFGELGLTGAVRPVAHTARRLAVAARHGRGAAIVPPRAEQSAHPQPPAAAPGAVRTVHAVSGVREALQTAFAR